MSTNYYELLDISPQATPGEIREAAQIKARKINDAFNALTEQEKKAAFESVQSQANAIKAALKLLTDTAQRRDYDLSLGLQKTPVSLENTDSNTPSPEKSDGTSIASIIFLIAGCILLYLIFFADDLLSDALSYFM